MFSIELLLDLVPLFTFHVFFFWVESEFSTKQTYEKLT